MAVTYTPITLTELTSATTEGTGVFDVLMRANKAHLEQEFKLGRIRGTEYATVYLGSLQAVLNAAVQFTLEREKQNLEAAVLVAQECKLRGEYDKVVAETGMIVDLRQKTVAETALLDQKTITEALQGNVTNKQADLLVAQAGAFDKDYQVKMQDLRVKAWATARTTDPDNTPAMTPF